jgi:DNA-binding NarL/FixJ family response regulator
MRGDPVPLTARERQLLHGIARGLTNRQIGEALGVTERTVKNKLAAVYHKVQVSNRTQLAIAVIRRRRLD